MDSNMNLMFKFVYVFAGLGFVVSFLFGLMGGIRFSSVLFTSIISTFISGGLGAGIHQILEQKIPESLKLFEISLTAPKAGDEGPGLPTKDEKLNVAEDDVFALGTEALSSSASIAEEKENRLAPAHSEAKGNYGTHIMVDKIKIRNEPKLLVDAIRTMIARDDDGSRVA